MNLIERLTDAGMANKVFTHADVKRVLNGTPASRYAFINKALKKNQIIQLKRGIYVMSQKYARENFSQFNIASQMIPHSYVSLESALSFHGWIPEKVTVISSVIHHGRTKAFNTPLGEFQYYFIPVQKYEFLTGVMRINQQQKPFLVASALRALMDLIYERNIEWQGLDLIIESFRIELDHLLTLKKTDFNEIKRVYRSKRILKFIRQLEDSIIHHG